MPLIAAAAIGAAATIGGAIISGNSARSAANAQQAAADAATAEQKREYDLSRQDNMPWLTTGSSALGKLAQLYGLDTIGPDGQKVAGGAPDQSSFFTSPDYNFRLNESIKGVDAGGAARGMLDSGATRKAELSYAGNLAAGEYNNYVSRLMGIAGVGQTAAGQNQQAGQHYADAVSNIAINQGNNRASSYLAQGQTYGNAVGQLGGIIGGVIKNWPTSGSSGGVDWSKHFGGGGG